MGIVEVFPGKYEDLAVVALKAEKSVCQGIISLLLEQRDCKKFALGFAHLSVGCVEMQYVHPPVAPVVAEKCFRLCNFVCVVRKCIVYPAAVDIHVFSEVLHGYTGALYMPAGVACSPRGIPLQGLLFEFRFCKPEYKVVFIAFVQVFFYAFTDSNGKILFIEIVEDVILFKL